MNKKVLIKILLLSVLYSEVYCDNDKTQISPLKPRAGDVITIKFNGVGTSLKDVENIDMITYLFSNEIEETYSIEMVREGSYWLGKIQTSPTTEFIALKFISDDIIENNDDEGYFIKFYDKDGIETIGSKLGYASAISSWGIRLLNILKQDKTAYGIMKEIFTAHPELKIKYLNYYLGTINGALKEKGNPIIAEELSELLKNENLTDSDYNTIINFYYRIREAEKAKEISNEVIKKFPYGVVAFNKRIDELNSVKDLNEQIKMVHQLYQDFPDDESRLSIAYDVFKSMIDKGRFELLNDWWLNNILTVKKKAAFLSLFLNTVLETNKETELALSIATAAVEEWRKELKTPTFVRLKNYSEKGWLQQMNVNLGRSIIEYSNVLKLLGRKEEALNSFEEGLSHDRRNILLTAFASAYFTLLVENNKQEKIKRVVEFALKKGLATPEMKEYSRKIFISENGNEKGYDKYLEQFESKVKEKIVTKLKKEIIKETAPQFSLVDLDGNNISLSQLKGKIIVLDFWATWCGPCKASFPGMQRAVNKFANDNDVKFLFISTYQTEKNKKEVVTNFITGNKYPFHVLLDENNEVAKSFYVTNIPTKIIIDKEGNIRFKSVGFSGTTEHLVAEISEMIRLLK
ncbi:MAG: TlpA disulfide reductase family protein [Bacteroidota bacterium]